MIITNRFVAINFPKTGSSFVRRVLKQLHNYEALHNRMLRRAGLSDHSSMVELILPQIDRSYPPDQANQHGTVRQIPPPMRDRPIMSVMRNPLERYVSTYRFGWWKRIPHTPIEDLQSEFPSFPDLTFEEYLAMMDTFGKRNRLSGIRLNTNIGFQTVQFLQFFCESPDDLFREIDDESVDQAHYQNALAEVTFLHQERLNRELYEYLLTLDYPEDEVRFVLDAAPINVTAGKRRKPDLASYYSVELARRVMWRERLLFDLFPEYLDEVRELLED